MPLAHARNPSYSGGTDQEDRGSNPAWAYSLRDAILKKSPSQKRTGGVAQGVGPKFKSQYLKKKKKENVEVLEVTKSGNTCSEGFPAFKYFFPRFCIFLGFSF
jgi:hypothetical protein